MDLRTPVSCRCTIPLLGLLRARSRSIKFSMVTTWSSRSIDASWLCRGERFFPLAKALLPGPAIGPSGRRWPQWVPDQRPAMATLPAGAEPNVVLINPQEPQLFSNTSALVRGPNTSAKTLRSTCRSLGSADAQLGLYLVVANGNRRFGCYVAATSAVPAWSAARTCSRTNGWTLDNGARLEGVSAIFNIFDVPAARLVNPAIVDVRVSAAKLGAIGTAVQPDVLRVLGSVTAGGRCACDGSKPICNDDWHGAFRSGRHPYSCRREPANSPILIWTVLRRSVSSRSRTDAFLSPATVRSFSFPKILRWNDCPSATSL